MHKESFYPIPSKSPIYAPNDPPMPFHLSEYIQGGLKFRNMTPFCTIFATTIAARTTKLSSTHSQAHPRRSSRHSECPGIQEGPRWHQHSSGNHGKVPVWRPAPDVQRGLVN